MTVTNPLTALFASALVLIGAFVWVYLTVPRAPKGPKPAAASNGFRSMLGVQRLPAPVLAFAITIYGVIASAFLVGLVAVLIQMPDAIREGDRLILLTLAAMVAGLSALVALPFKLVGTAQNERQTYAGEQGLVTDRINKAVENLGAEKTNKRALLDEDGQPITVDETVPNMEVRIGGLLALDRIARENDAFHVQVMQILCAYVRQNAPSSKAVEPPQIFIPVQDDEAEGDRDTDWSGFREAYYDRLLGHAPKRMVSRRGRYNSYISRLESIQERLPAPRNDLQIALELIGRRSERQRRMEAAWLVDGPKERDSPFDFTHPSFPELTDDPEEGICVARRYRRESADLFERLKSAAGYRPDLRNTNLEGFNLSGLDLRGFLFRDSSFYGATLKGTLLQGSDLSYAKMQGTDLEGTNLQAADLNGANLSGAFLRLAHLQGARLDAAEIQAAIFADAALDGAVFLSTQGQGALFPNARLKGAIFDGAKLPGAILVGAQAHAASFRDCQMQLSENSNANFQGASFTSAKMQGSQFSDATLNGTIFKKADLTRAGFSMAKMVGTEFSEATLHYARFLSARMQAVFLHKAQLQGADLRNTKLHGVVDASQAIFSSAKLAGNDLTEGVFTPNQIQTTFGDASVVLPSAWSLSPGKGVLSHWSTDNLAWADYDETYAAWLADPDAYDPNGTY